MEKTIKISGMRCKSCAMLLEDVIGEIHGVDKVEVDSKSGTAKILFSSPSVLEQIKTAVKAEGYRVVD